MLEIYTGISLLLIASIASYIGLRVKSVILGKILSLFMLFGYLSGWSFISLLFFGGESSGLIVLASILVFAAVMTGISAMLTFKLFKPKTA